MNRTSSFTTSIRKVCLGVALTGALIITTHLLLSGFTETESEQFKGKQTAVALSLSSDEKFKVQKERKRVIFSTGTRSKIYDFDEILYFTTQPGGLTLFASNGEQPKTGERLYLKVIDEKLADCKDFMRVSNQYILNLEKIREYRVKKNDLIVKMEDGKEVIVGREHKNQVRDWLERDEPFGGSAEELE